MFTLILILLAVAVALWLIPSKKGKSGSVVDSITSSFSSAPVSLFGQQLDEEADMLAAAYRNKAKAAREAEVIEKASTLLSK
jgi:hypothetical protein